MIVDTPMSENSKSQQESKKSSDWPTSSQSDKGKDQSEQSEENPVICSFSGSLSDQNQVKKPHVFKDKKKSDFNP